MIEHLNSAYLGNVNTQVVEDSGNDYVLLHSIVIFQLLMYFTLPTDMLVKILLFLVGNQYIGTPGSVHQNQIEQKPNSEQ